MKLIWSAHARADRAAIFEFIESDNPTAAADIDEQIKKQVETLILLPESGRKGRVKGTRELVVARTPFIAAYRIAGESIRILRILHGAQRWPKSLP